MVAAYQGEGEEEEQEWERKEKKQKKINRDTISDPVEFYGGGRFQRSGKCPRGGGSAKLFRAYCDELHD